MSASSSSPMASNHCIFFPLLLLCSAIFGTDNAMPLEGGGVEDVQLQQLQRQPFALFVVQEQDEMGGIGSASLVAKRHLFDALSRQGRSPRSASSATMRNALVRFGKRGLLPSIVLDDKRNPPQPFVRFGRSAATDMAEPQQQQQQLYFPGL